MKETNDIFYKIKGLSGKYGYEICLSVISVIFLILRIRLASTLNLGNDEAHYYVWSLKPSLGYLDDAPFVSYVIGFFTGLMGKSELSVRFGAVIFSFFDGFLIYYLTYLLFRNKRASFFAFLFFLSAAIFGAVLSVMMLPDAPLLFFYLCFLIAFYSATEAGVPAGTPAGSDLKIYDGRKRENPKNQKSANSFPAWMLAGFFLGLAFLSKYTAALIPPAVFLYLLVSKKNRRLLKTIYPYASMGIALLVFSPVIYWNFTHNFISFRFQLSHGFSHPKPGLPLFLAGWFGQFLVVTPFVYIFLIGTFAYSLKSILRQNGGVNGATGGTAEKKNRSRVYEGFLYSVCLSMPVLLFFIINGYSHRILVHWPDIGYLPAFPAMGYAADLTAARRAAHIVKKSVWRTFAKYYVYFSLFFAFFLSFVLFGQIYYNLIPVGKIIKYIDKEKRLKKGGIFPLIPHIPGKAATADITNDLFGWRRGARYIKAVYESLETSYGPIFIMTHHYAVADELVYYGGFKPAVNIYNISGFLNQYDLEQNLNKINGENALFIMDNKYMLEPEKKYNRYFKSIKKIGSLDIYVKSRLVRVYYLYLMKSFMAKKAAKRLALSRRMY